MKFPFVDLYTPSLKPLLPRSVKNNSESLNYYKQMDLYIFGKDADLSEWDNAIKDYENERSRCKDFDP